MSRKPRVFLTKEIPPDCDGMRMLKETCDVTIYDEIETGLRKIPRDLLLKKVRDQEALMITTAAPIDKEVLDAAVIATQTVGLDHIDLVECERRNVVVGYTPDILTDAVAEATVALTLSAARRHKQAMSEVVTGGWASAFGDKCLYMAGKELKNSTVGIVGLGRIGMAVARLLRGFRIARLYYSGHGRKPYDNEVDAEYVPFRELLEKSDFVVVCCSSNNDNFKMFDGDTFLAMKHTAVFVNAARGSLVDQEALYVALTTGQIFAAGLDATTPEPLPTDHTLLTLPNCTILPHIGSATVTTRHAMAKLSVKNVLAGLLGEPLPSGVK